MPPKSLRGKATLTGAEEDTTGLAVQICPVSPVDMVKGLGAQREAYSDEKEKKVTFFLIIPKYPLFVKQLSC